MTGPRVRRASRRFTVGGLGALVLLLWATSLPARAGWTGATIQNSDNTLATGTASMSFRHAYPTSQTCTGTLGQASVSCPGTIIGTDVPTSGPQTLTDTITNLGTTTGTTSTLSVPACGAVPLRNLKGGNANPMLPRFNHTFQTPGPLGMSAVTPDGTTGNGTSPQLRTWQRPSATAVNGLGVWFRISPNQAGGLVSFTTAATGVDVATEKITVAMNNPMLRITYPYNTGTTHAYSPNVPNDGNWHFVYIRFEPTQTLVYLDGNTSFTRTPDSIGTTPATINGYWRYGRVSASASGISGGEYFKGSLSNIVYFDGNAPAAPTAAQLSSASAFQTWAAGAAEHWPMDDSGTDIYTGTADWLNSPGTACSQVQMAWGATNPAGSAPARSLATWTTGTTIPAPAPGVSQTSTLTTSRITGFDNDAAGLWLIPTMQMVHTTGSWTQTFSWSSTPTGARILIR